MLCTRAHKNKNLVTELVWAYLRLAPIHWALSDETGSPCSRVGGRSVIVLSLLCTEPRSSLMSLDKHLRTAEEEGRQCG